MTRNIYLKGKMGKLFGEHWTLNAATVQEAMHGIDVQRQNKLTKYLVECTEKGIMFHVQKGEEFLDYTNLSTTLGEEDLIITPIPAGAGGLGDVFKAVLGIALIITAIFFPGSLPAIGALTSAQVAAGAMLIGSLLVMQGITGLMTPKKATEGGEGYFFDGPVNTVKQGVPVPLLYGRLIIGGSPINFAFLEGDMSVGGNTGYFITPSTEGASAANSATAISSGIQSVSDAVTWELK